MEHNHFFFSFGCGLFQKHFIKKEIDPGRPRGLLLGHQDDRLFDLDIISLLDMRRAPVVDLAVVQKLIATEAHAHYYETSEWCQHDQGLRYARSDESMDSLVYLPNRNMVCWFGSRKVAHVQPNGTFTLKWDNGGRLAGVIRPLDSQIELVGLPGTSEDGVTEIMVRHD